MRQVVGVVEARMSEFTLCVVSNARSLKLDLRISTTRDTAKLGLNVGAPLAGFQSHVQIVLLNNIEHYGSMLFNKPR
jgi:hypothetical protein